MKKLLPIAALLATTALAGCASTSAPTYDPGHSKAYNLAQAGGLYDAKDYDVPKEQREGVLGSAWDATGDALLFNSQHGFGLDWGTSLGLGLLTSAFEPDGVMERDSVFGWVPETKAGDAGEAWELLSNTLLDGIEKALQQANVKYIVSNKNLHKKILFVSEYIFSSVQIIAPEHGCPDWEESGRDLREICYLTTSVYAPTKEPRKAPNFVAAGANGYGFNANDETDYSRIKVNLPDRAKLNKHQILMSISKELPPWVFIFVASEKQDEGGYSAPVILTEGKAELFITPED